MIKTRDTIVTEINCKTFRERALLFYLYAGMAWDILIKGKARMSITLPGKLETRKS